MRRFLLALLGVYVLQAAAAAQGYDQLLPDSTIFYLSVENLSRTKSRFEEGTLGALWKDPAVQTFAEKPRKEWNDWIEETREKDGVTPEDVLEVLAGQAALAVLPTEGGDDAEPLILGDIGDHEDRVREMMRRLERKLVDEKDFSREEEEFRGITITRYHKEASETDEEKNTCWLMDGNLFALGSSIDALKRLLVRKDGGAEDSLAAREAYQKMRARLGGRADVVAYLDGANLIKMLQAAGDLDEEFTRIAGALGVLAIDAVGAQAMIEPSAVSLHAYVAVTGEKRGLLRLFAAKNSRLMPPKFAPPDADGAGAFSLDVADLWQEARTVMDKIMPGLTGMVDAWLAQMKQATGVDLAADILGSLGSELSYYTKLPSGKDLETPPGIPVSMLAAMPQMVVAMQVKDAERLDRAVTMLTGMAGPMLTPLEYLGSKMWIIQTGSEITPAIALLPDRFLFGLRADDVKEVVSRYGKEDAKGLIDREDFARALENAPAERISIAVQDEAKSIRHNMLFSWLSLMQPGQAPLDLGALPALEVLQQYLGLSTSYFVNEEDGIRYSYAVSLKPQKKD